MISLITFGRKAWTLLNSQADEFSYTEKSIERTMLRLTLRNKQEINMDQKAN